MTGWSARTEQQLSVSRGVSIRRGFHNFAPVKKNLSRNRRLFKRQPDFFPPAPTRIDCFRNNRQNDLNSRNRRGLQ